MSTHQLTRALLKASSRITRSLDGSLSSIKGISFSEYQLLSAIRDRPNASATRVDLAAAVGLSPSGVTRALKPLEKLGFVETIRDDRDARRALAQLTDAGVVLVSDAEGVVNDTLDRLEERLNLSQQDEQTFTAYLEELGRS